MDGVQSVWRDEGQGVLSENPAAPGRLRFASHLPHFSDGSAGARVSQGKCYQVTAYDGSDPSVAQGATETAFWQTACCSIARAPTAPARPACSSRPRPRTRLLPQGTYEFPDSYPGVANQRTDYVATSADVTLLIETLRCSSSCVSTWSRMLRSSFGTGRGHDSRRTATTLRSAHPAMEQGHRDGYCAFIPCKFLRRPTLPHPVGYDW